MFRRVGAGKGMDLSVKGLSEATVIAILVIPRPVVGNAEEPASNVLLRATGCHMPLEAEKGILNDILSLVTGKP